MTQNYKIFVNQKPLILTADEEQYFAAPPENIKSYIYCKMKVADDLQRVLQICENDEKLQLALVYHPNLETLKETFESLFTTISAAGGVVINASDEVLVIFRKGKWDLPKGKADKGETAEQTALREVEEETGLSDLTITKNIGSTYHTYQEKGEKMLKVTTWFEMKSSNIQPLVPQVEEKITEVKWIQRNELKPIIDATYPALAELLEQYR